MKKRLLVSAISVVLATSSSVTSAISVDVTRMNFAGNYAAIGTLSDDGSGHVDSGPFYGVPVLLDNLEYFDTTGVELHYDDANAQGAFDYAFTLSEGEIAFGLLFDWNSASGRPILAIMDCGAGNAGDVCTGRDVLSLTGPFLGQSFSLDGVVSAVPVPAAVWLMGSGLVGLVSLARRRNYL